MIKNSQPILLVGTGPMALEYVKVLQSIGSNFIVVGRGNKSAQQFAKAVGKFPIAGGLKNFFLTTNYPIKKAIVAVSEDQLGIATIELLEQGVKSILVEKPGGATFQEIRTVKKEAEKIKARIFVAYNRRFYASAAKACEMIKEDGGVLSFNFEFTELNDRVSLLKKALGVKENWFLHNSTHVVDLAFFLAGHPQEIRSFTSGKLSWHPKASIFSGAGVTKNGALFSYQADWEAPGRWNLEILTKKHRLILKPIEKLQVQNTGSFDISEIDIENEIDLLYKPGLYRQVESFLGDKKNLCTIDEQCNNLPIYEQILNGSAQIKK